MYRHIVFVFFVVLKVFSQVIVVLLYEAICGLVEACHHWVASDCVLCASERSAATHALIARLFIIFIMKRFVVWLKRVKSLGCQ
jgi:hypothetical protein